MKHTQRYFISNNVFALFDMKHTKSHPLRSVVVQENINKYVRCESENVTWLKIYQDSLIRNIYFDTYDINNTKITAFEQMTVFVDSLQAIDLMNFKRYLFLLVHLENILYMFCIQYEESMIIIFHKPQLMWPIQ